ncbi:uncharacterized protein BROUX77_001805 [Berkeleyomyces rouxiae]|uniref:uncharacterized protein n=1 Tax=Berkeleyomyces rouxiae TaxID=2035830 RepID=UPI003B7AA1DF
MTDKLGRHDLLQCQSANLEQQLKAGIRYIDISGRLIDDKIKIFHGNSYTDYNLDHLLTTAFGFLDQNPREALILRLHKGSWSSGEEDAFEHSVMEYLESKSALALRAQHRIYRGGLNGDISVPTLGGTRGRILILQDFNSEEGPARYGVPWRSNAMVVSDWKASLGHLWMPLKWHKVKRAIKAANKASDTRLHITYTSVSFGATPYKTAGGRKGPKKGINDHLGGLLNTPAISKTGVVVMDFPGKKLINQIIKKNDQHILPSQS